VGRREYARLLLDVIDFASPAAWKAIPQATAMGQATGIEERLLAILNSTQPARRTWPAYVLALGVACAILPCELHIRLSRAALPAVLAPHGNSPAGTNGAQKNYRVIESMCCPS
jgi:hypothetical protein